MCSCLGFFNKVIRAYLPKSFRPIGQVVPRNFRSCVGCLLPDEIDDFLAMRHWNIADETNRKTNCQMKKSQWVEFSADITVERKKEGGRRKLSTPLYDVKPSLFYQFVDDAVVQLAFAIHHFIHGARYGGVG